MTRQLLFILSLMLSFSLTVSSQGFVSKDNKWVIAESTSYGWEWVVQYRLYWFKDEVEIDGTEYLHLYTAKLGDPAFEATGIYFREQNSGVFRYNSNNGDLDLIYNFNDEKGDSFFIENSIHGKGKGEIIRTKSLALLDRSCVTSQEINLTFDSQRPYEDTFVERMGSLTAPFKPGTFYPSYKHYTEKIACFISDDTLLYSLDPDLSFCSQFAIIPPEVNLATPRFVMTDNLWVLNEVNDENGTVSSKYFEYWFDNHTTINGVKYLELIKSEINDLNEIPTGQFYRENNNKVYHYNGIEESLVYDFDLSIGDTLRLGDTGSVIDSIENLELLRGEERTLLRTSSDKFHLIDAIGTNLNTFNPKEFDESSYTELSCFFKYNSANWSLIYSASTDFICSELYDHQEKFTSSENKWEIVSKDIETSLPIDTFIVSFGPEKIIDGKLYRPAIWRDYDTGELTQDEPIYYRQDLSSVFLLENNIETKIYSSATNVGSVIKLQSDNSQESLEVVCENHAKAENGDQFLYSTFEKSWAAANSYNYVIANIGMDESTFDPLAASKDRDNYLSKFYRNDTLVFDRNTFVPCKFEILASGNRWIVEERFFDEELDSEISQLAIYLFEDNSPIVLGEERKIMVRRPQVPSQDVLNFGLELDYSGQVETNFYPSGYRNRILYFFEYDLGDIISFDNGLNNLVVDNIVPVTLENGYQVNSFSLYHEANPSDDKFKIIDGIGMNSFPLFPHRFANTDTTETLICFYQGDELIYRSPEFIDCRGTRNTTSVATEIEEMKPSLHFDGHNIIVSNVAGLDLSLSLYDVTGRLVDEVESMNGIFQTPEVPTGLYICVLKKSNELVHTQTLFIN